MKNKIQNYLFIGVFMAFIIISGIFEFVLIDKEESLIENRNLTTFSDLKETSYLGGDFQSTLESAMADQFIGRYQYVNFKNKLDYEFSNLAFMGIDFDYVLKPLSNSGVMQIGNSKFMIDVPLTYDEVSNQRVKIKTEQINDFALRNPEKEVYVYLPVANHETSIFDEANGLDSAGQKYIKTIEDNIEVPFSKLQFDNLEEIEEYCFSSDHHLNYKGSYRMYTELLELLGDESTIKEPTSVDCHVGETFYGTYSSRTGYVLEPSEYCVYNFDLAPHSVYYEGKRVYPKATEDFLTYDPNQSKDEYPYYYNISYDVLEPLSYYDYNQPEMKNVLIVGDSLSRSFIEIFASSFNKTWRLIPYDYTKKTGEYFDYDGFVEENNVDIVIFSYGLVNYYYRDEWGDRFMETTIEVKGE